MDDKRLAVLIDADNISYKHVANMLSEIANYGTPTYKRIYGDWTQPTMTGWKNVLLEYAITPIQQYGYTTGKNSTDSALIIDAMDILYSGRVDGFCIVSSDSDFTRLALRLREAGMTVFGIGERKTPNAFIAACDKFIYLEVLITSDTHRDTIRAPHAEDTAKPGLDTPEQLQRVITAVIEEVADDDGWAFLGQVGNMLNKLHPDFDPRNYGYAKLSQLISNIDAYEVESRNTADPHVKLIYIRPKRAPAPKPAAKPAQGSRSQSARSRTAKAAPATQQGGKKK